MNKLKIECRTSDDDEFLLIDTERGITFFTTEAVEVLLSESDVKAVIDFLLQREGSNGVD